jgi:hypothetical protein
VEIEAHHDLTSHGCEEITRMFGTRIDDINSRLRTSGEAAHK